MAFYQTLLVCSRLKQLRLSKKWSQFYVCEKLNLSQPAYSRLENGEVELNLTRLKMLSILYDVPVSTILEGF